jgi:anthranilate phosphoribosyltransferase
VLDGKAGPQRDIVILNAAAALLVAGRVRTLREGAAEAARSIDAGNASTVLERMKGVLES